MNQPKPRPQPVTPPEAQYFKMYYDQLAVRRDLSAAQKFLLAFLCDQQKRHGFAFGSWDYYGRVIGRNKKTIKRTFVTLDAKFPGLFLIRRFERAPNHVTVNLDALDRQPNLPGIEPHPELNEPLVDSAGNVLQPTGQDDGGGKSAPSPGGKSAPPHGGESAPSLGAKAPPGVGAKAPPYQTSGIKLTDHAAAPPAAGEAAAGRDLFDKRPILYDPRTAIGKATPTKPLEAVYVDEWRARVIQFVIINGKPRLITHATWQTGGLILQLHVGGATIGTTERITFSTKTLFSGSVQFGAPA